MAITTISDLKSALNSGARSNLFKVTLTGLEGTGDEDFSYLCKAAQLPGSTLGIIEVPFSAGRRFKAAGDRTFADWTVTIINDENQTLRRAFNAWVNLISKGNYESPTKSSATGANYYQDITCSHLKADNTVSRKYQLADAFPTDVSAIDLSFDSTDTLSEFTVNFQYHYLKAGNSTTSFATGKVDLAVST